MTNYLVRRKGRYFVRFRVPQKVRHAFYGRSEIWQTTGTGDQPEAHARALKIVADLKRQVQDVRNGKLAPAVEIAATWRERIAAVADTGGDGAAEAIENVTRESAIKLAAKLFVAGGYGAVQAAVANGYEGNEAAAVAALGGSKAETFLHVALLGERQTVEAVEVWAAHRLSEVEPRTAAMDKSDVMAFAQDHQLLRSITKKAVSTWAAKLRTEQGLSPKTIQRKLTALRAFWRYLQDREEVSADVDPFAKVNVRERSKDTARRAREAFKPDEVVKLYVAAKDKGDSQLADLIQLAAWTGARIEELCQLKRKDVVDGRLRIDDAKTPSGNRWPPIHERLEGTVKRLMKGCEGPEDYLLGPVGGKNKYEERSAGIGKRFGRLKSAMGFPASKVFHSIRRTVVTQLDDAGQALHVIAALVGHERKDFTGKRYSDAELKALMSSALCALIYPPPL